MGGQDLNATSTSLPKLALLAFALATPLAAVAIHITMAVVAPGDGGTALALGSGIILLLIAMVVGFVGVLLFPIAAVLSWPLRNMAFQRPILSYMSAIGFGLGAGFWLQALDVKGGPADNFSAPIAGAVYAIVWIALMRKSVREMRTDSSANAIQ